MSNKSDVTLYDYRRNEKAKILLKYYILWKAIQAYSMIPNANYFLKISQALDKKRQ